jgi:Phr family secreted Rap phosphatase inhibitor
MKKFKSVLISFVILLVIVCGFIINPPAQPEKPITNCDQYVCVSPPQITTIYLYHYEKDEQVYVGYCTTGENGCCPEPFTLIQGEKYNVKPFCQPYAQGYDFWACTDVIYLECPE